MDLAYCIAASLAGGDTDALGAALAACARDPASYEASVRATPAGTLRAGRMMVEQASREALDAIARAVAVSLPSSTTAWLQLAAAERLPLIAGWDMRGGGAQRCVKLYINASDASQATRRRLCAALVSGVAVPNPPAVLGMNALPEGVVETKLYVQSDDAVTLASGHNRHAKTLAAAARDEGADAGGVLSFDVHAGTLHPRAFFIALREPAGATAWRCVRSLRGYDPSAVESLLPFAPAPPRSVGVSLDGSGWTLYCKPRDSGRAPQSLEPVAIYRSGDTEVGVFVEPTQHAARAFRRTERHAISVRVREGAPAPHNLEALVDWFADELGAAEPIDVVSLSDPPSPWRRVDTTQRRDTAGAGA